MAVLPNGGRGNLLRRGGSYLKEVFDGVALLFLPARHIFTARNNKICAFKPPSDRTFYGVQNRYLITELWK